MNDVSLTAIADSIRGKLDVETTYLPSQMAAAIDSIPTGGGGDLTSADEGKVVVESGGSYVLAAQTSRTVIASGTYDTTTNNEVIVDVSDDSYTTYWTLAYMLETSGQIGVGGRSGGFKFVSSELAFISKIRVLSTASTVNVYVTRGDGRVVSSRVGVQVEPNQWSEIVYSNPITIYKGAPYTVWYSQGDGEPLVYFAVATSSRISYITKYENLYSESADTTPTTNAGDSVTYGIDVYVEYYTKDSRQMIDKTITQNGIYSASGDNVDGYSCVTVNVAGGGGSGITSADEGKVVVESDGDYVLQAQTSRTVSQNGTYDTTTNDEVVVNVSGGSAPTGFTYYNGYLLPTIPTIAGYDYVFIRKNDQSNTYDALYGLNRWHSRTSGTTPTLDNWFLVANTSAGAMSSNDYKYYSTSQADPQSWSEFTDETYEVIGTNNDRDVIWTSHDIMVSSSSSAGVLLKAGYPVS